MFRTPPNRFFSTSALFIALAVLPPSLITAAADDRVDRLGQTHKDWLEKEVVYIISDKEREGFLDLQSEEERRAFIAAFWYQRDPDKLTPVNEFKEEHYRRIDFANQYLGRESAVPGWMTDRGRMLIILGEPAEREEFTSVNSMYPTELWFYHQERGKSLPPLYLLFFQDGHAGPYRLFNHALDEPSDLLPADGLNIQGRDDAYFRLQEISPQLAHSVITMRADQGVGANLVEPQRNALDTSQILSDITVSPFRRLDTRYVDAADEGRGIVETEYLFNYVPNTSVAHVIPGPAGTHFVHYSIEIAPQNMTLAKDENRYYTTFEYRGEVTTEDGEVLETFVREPYVQLSESQFQEVGARSFAYRSMFPLRDGSYQFRVVLKNRARSEYTIFEAPVEVPKRSENEPFLADPVLLYGFSEHTSEPGRVPLYRCYRMGRWSLDPNAKSTFVVEGKLLAYVPVAGVTEGSKISATIEVADDAPQLVDAPSDTIPIAASSSAEQPPLLQMSLQGIPSGRYRLRVALLSPDGTTLSTTNAPFDVSPRSSIERPWALRDSIDGERTGLVKAALAEQYLRLNDPESARAMARDALDEDPNAIPARLILARFSLDEESYQDAVRLLEPARAQSPEDVDILQALGDAHFRLKNYGRAKELFSTALQLRGPTVTMLNALAVCASETGDLTAAESYLQRSLELDGSQASVKEFLDRLQASARPR